MGRGAWARLPPWFEPSPPLPAPPLAFAARLVPCQSLCTGSNPPPTTLLCPQTPSNRTVIIPPHTIILPPGEYDSTAAPSIGTNDTVWYPANDTAPLPTETGAVEVVDSGTEDTGVVVVQPVQGEEEPEVVQQPEEPPAQEEPTRGGGGPPGPPASGGHGGDAYIPEGPPPGGLGPGLGQQRALEASRGRAADRRRCSAVAPRRPVPRGCTSAPADPRPATPIRIPPAPPNPPGSCPGTTLDPIPPLGGPPGEPKPTVRQMFGSMHGIGYLGFCAVRRPRSARCAGRVRAMGVARCSRLLPRSSTPR